MIGAICLITLFSLIFFIWKREITASHLDVLAILLLIYFYFMLSFFLSNQNPSDFFSYRFIRNDGNFFFCYLPFFFYAVAFFNYKTVLKNFLKLLFFAFTVFSVLGIFSLFVKKYTVYFFSYLDIYRGPVFAAFNYAHNATASAYAVVCLIALTFYLKEQRRSYKIMYFFILLFCLVSLVLTKSRGSWLGFLAGFLIILWIYLSSFKKFIIICSILLSMAIALVYFSGYYKEIFRLFNPNEPNINNRLALWKGAWSYFLRSPIFGIGFGRYNDAGPTDLNFYGIKGFVSYYIGQNYRFSTAHAHNSYLQFLAETGIVGLGLLITFWVSCFMKILKFYKNATDVFSKQVFLSGIGMIVCLFILAFTENYFSATTVIILISSYLSLSFGFGLQERSNKIELNNQK